MCLVRRCLTFTLYFIIFNFFFWNKHNELWMQIIFYIVYFHSNPITLPPFRDCFFLSVVSRKYLFDWIFLLNKLLAPFINQSLNLNILKIHFQSCLFFYFICQSILKNLCFINYEWYLHFWVSDTFMITTFVLWANSDTLNDTANNNWRNLCFIWHSSIPVFIKCNNYFK